MREEFRDKPALRKAMLLRLQALTSEDRAARSERICARIADSQAWQTARSVLLFSPLKSEPQIVPLHTAAVTAGKITTIVPATLRVEADLALATELDLVLVPGLAFSLDGHRLGRGGGFFDRLLAGRAARAYRLGVCFDFQRVDSIPTEAHDVTVDAVITDADAV